MKKEKKETPVEKQRPIHEVALAFGGNLLKAAIWQYQEKEERPRYTVTFSRGYCEKDGSTWAYNGFFTRDECLGLARVAEVAHDWIVNRDSKRGA